MKVLLHTCCSCCALGAIEILKAENHLVSCYFYNPNIHPSLEYISRYESMKMHAEKIGIKLSAGEYEIERYFEAINGDYGDGRCPKCYRLRLEKAAEFAKEHGFEGISTTLLTSIYQDHYNIKEIGETVCAENGLKFIYFDNRDDFKANQEKSKSMEMYRQKYCGCVFSEKERYQKKLRRVFGV